MAGPPPLLFDRPTLVAGEDKLQTDVIAGLLRGVLTPEVIRTRDFQHASSLAHAGGFALVVVGFDRSTVDAVEFIMSLRRNRANRDRTAPIIVLRTNPTENDYKVAQEAGATAVFAKPLALGPLQKFFAKVKSDVRPFVDVESYVGPCRRRAIIKGGPRRRSGDQPDPATQSYATRAIKDAVLMFNQINTGELDKAADTCSRLRRLGNVEVDAALVETLDLIAPFLHGSELPDRDSLVRLGGAAIVRLTQMIDGDEGQRRILADNLKLLGRKMASAA